METTRSTTRQWNKPTIFRRNVSSIYSDDILYSRIYDTCVYCHRRGAADLENPKRWKKFAKRERHNNASAPHSAPSFSILLLWNGKQWGGAIRTEIKAILKGLPTRKCSRKGRRALCPNAESIRCIVPLNHCWNLDLNIIYIYIILYIKSVDRSEIRQKICDLWRRSVAVLFLFVDCARSSAH